MGEKKSLKGGEFLLEEPINTEAVYPEQFSEEHKMLAKTARDFAEKEILPSAEEMEKHNYEVTKKLLKKAGELGFTAVDVPEKYGGLGLDKISSMIVTEKLGVNGSFSATLGAHSGIGTLPIVYFGNEEQRSKYLPDLASVNKVSAYALTEPGAGSDALSIKTKAELSSDGKHYILNGNKQFITNSGFADMWIVFAKIDGEKFTGFIVEKTDGLEVGAEEKKMGLKGSSTCSLTLDNVKIPVENVLGEIGKGHKIAFNILNIGRLKLAAGALGGSKRILRETVVYTKERKQFGKPISDFEMIRKKFANGAVRIYGTESIVYRIASSMDAMLSTLQRSDPNYDTEVRKIIEEFSVEDSIAKVYGSETLGTIVDECFQSFGGYGYIEEYPVERSYRDARINRIFEGTNEINRLVITGMLLRKAMKGEIPLMDKAGSVPTIIKNLEGYRDFSGYGDLSECAHLLDAAKNFVIYGIYQSATKYMKELENQQGVLECLSNSIAALYILDSSLNRCILSAKEEAKNIVRLLTWDSISDVISNIVELSIYINDPTLKDTASTLYTMLTKSRIDPLHLRKEIGSLIVEREGYPLDY